MVHCEKTLKEKKTKIIKFIKVVFLRLYLTLVFPGNGPIAKIDRDGYYKKDDRS